MAKWLCHSCGYIYDEEHGDPDAGINPGTAFHDIPAGTQCPICGVTFGDPENWEKLAE